MPLDISRIQALCFDVDGTLSDTDDQFVLRLIRWLRPFRFAFPQGDPHPFARKVVMATENPGTFFLGLPDRIGIDSILAGLADFVYQIGLGRSTSPFLLIQGVHETLQQLSPHYPMTVVTARGHRNTQAFLEQFELKYFFQHIATGQTCRHTKPYPDPILWVAENIKVPPEACLMIGDTKVDIRAGKAAGAQTVGVLCGFGEEKELIKEGADLILPDITHLPGILLR